jgi:RNAse (barnase) inhibitor barstar
MEPTDRLTFVIEGSRITSLEGFYEELSRVILPGKHWGKNLDALDDVLSGGFLPDAPVIEIIWSNSNMSREHLGYAETVRQLEVRLKRCHPNNRSIVSRELHIAQKNTGPTAFDWIVEIFKDHEQSHGEKGRIVLKLN